MNEYQRKLDARFRAYPLGPPPSPWRRSFIGSIGGLLAVGFAQDSDLLLMVSTAGRGVLDCRTGERLARDDEESLEWADPVHLTAVGIGPLAGQTIRVAGVWGGGLPVATVDGWHLEVVPLDWAEYVVLLCPPQAHVFSDRTFGQCTKVYAGDPVRACGFSDTGRSLLIAEDSGVSLAIYHRERVEV